MRYLSLVNGVVPWIPSVSLWYDLAFGCFHWVDRDRESGAS